MGGGCGRTYGGRGALKGKGVGTAGKAVAKDATLHVDLLRAFPAEDGPILLHRNGARSDAQVLEPTFLTQLLAAENQELLNRPAKGLSMLAGSIIHGTVALQRSDQAMVRADRTALLNQLQELLAFSLHDSWQKSSFAVFFPDARQPAGRTGRPVGTAGAHYVWALHAVLSTVLMF